jgi:hypothetical protein
MQLGVVICIFGILFFYHLPNSYGTILPNTTTSKDQAITNGSYVVVNRPSNVTIMSDNKSRNSSDAGFSNSIVAAAGAISGAAVGSFGTYLYGKRLDDKKAKREDDKETELRMSLRESVRHELLTFENFMGKILSDYKPDAMGNIYIDDSPLEEIIAKMKTFPRQYDSLTLERKAVIFEGKALAMIQQAYEVCNNFFLDLQGKKIPVAQQHLIDIRQIVTNALSSIPPKNTT